MSVKAFANAVCVTPLSLSEVTFSYILNALALTSFVFRLQLCPAHRFAVSGNLLPLTLPLDSQIQCLSQPSLPCGKS